MRWWLLLSLCACGDPTLVDVKNYSKSCMVDADCVAIVAGKQCSPCGCPNDAIAKRDSVLYEADRSSARAACGGISKVACAPCEAAQVVCSASVCELK